MANAGGRLAGTVLSGLLYQYGAQQGPATGLIWCLWASVALVLAAGAISLWLPANTAPRTRPIALTDLGE
jgi:hypothetical protein